MAFLRFREGCSSYLLTRRVTQRQYRLKPNKTVKQIFLYCLAYAAAKYDIALHGLVIMSNHYHLIASETGPSSNISRFMNSLNGSVAKSLNGVYKCDENMWSSEPFHELKLESQEQMLNALVYTICNPVAAGLVSTPIKWPGFITHEKTVGNYEVKLKRPKELGFKSKKPKSLTIKFTMPPQFGDYSQAEFQERIGELVSDRIELIVEDRRSRGLYQFAGAASVRARHHFSSPDSEEPEKTYLPPVYDTDDHDVSYQTRYKAFVQAYREAYDCWINNKDTVFPHGTYKMVAVYGAKSNQVALT